MIQGDEDEALIDAADVPFGAALEGPLIAGCGGRLSKINWFRTVWQRGGALTGYATFTDDAGAAHDVVVKLPVPPRERRWLVKLQAQAMPSLERSDESFGFARKASGVGGVVPRVFAHGEAVGGYDFAWVVMERLRFGPLGEKWEGREFDLIVNAAGRFYAETAGPGGTPIDPAWGVRKRDWPAILAAGRKQVQARGCAEPQRWKAALKRAAKKLDGWVEVWDARSGDDWCHGDLHLGNAMSRVPHDTPLSDADTIDAAALIDLAEVRVGHWVEDAVYLEHLFWSQPHRLHGRKLVSMMARERKARGLTAGEDWPELARVKRALLALATATKFHEVGRGHVAAALGVLEREV